MDLKECMSKIVGNNGVFPSGCYFDSHTVITELRSNEEYYITYLKEVNQFNEVKGYHSYISQLIGALDFVETAGESRSHSVFGEITPNKLWRKK